jgi:hypothetical protein
MRRGSGRTPHPSRLKPFRQERICIHIVCPLEVYSAVLQQRSQSPIVERIEQLGTSADMTIADEDLRDGWRLGADLEQLRIWPPQLPLWYSAESRSTERQGMSNDLNSLRTDQQNSHHSRANITTGCLGFDVTPVTNASASDVSCTGSSAADRVDGGGLASNRLPRRGLRDLDLFSGHFRRKVLEERCAQVTLASIRQHAQDLRALPGLSADLQCP